MSPRNPETNERMRAQSRRRIVDAALELFGRRGFAATTIAAVAQQAGVSKGLAYNYFASKEAILEAVLEDSWQDSFQATREAAAIEDPAARLRFLVERTLARAAEQPELIRLGLQLLLQPETQETLLRAKRRLAREFRDWQRVVSRTLGELGIEQADGEVVFLSALLNGITLTWLVTGRQIDTAALENRVLRLYGVSPKVEVLP